MMSETCGIDSANCVIQGTPARFLRVSPSLAIRGFLSFIALMLSTVLPLHCLGGGIFHVYPPRLNGTTVAVARPSILLSKTLVTVDEGTIEYRFDQTFFNDNEFRLEGLFILPLTVDELGDRPEITINGKPVSCEIVPPEKFFPTLRQLTTFMKDPSLLELAGRSVVLVRPLYIEARGQKSIRVQYKKPLSIQSDFLDIEIPLIGERYSLGPVGELQVRVRFKMSRSVRTVFSPTHQLDVFRETLRRCLVTAGTVEKRVHEDFRLLTTFSGEGLNVRVFPYKTPDSPGTFMAFLEPPANLPTNDQYDKNVVFLMDASGSLGKANLDLAKRLMVSGLERLRPHDFFNVLIIGTSVQALAPEMLSATTENVTEAVRFVTAVAPVGGTDLCNGLVYALDEFSSRNRPNIVIMAGDGRGTIGTTQGEAIVQEVRRSNRNKARIFALGLGSGADMATLDKIAVSTSGTSLHYAGKEDFQSVVSRFFAGVSPPRVSDLSLRFTEVTTQAIHPDPIPDIFGTESAVVFGQYMTEDNVQCKVGLRGKIGGRFKTVTKTVTLPNLDETHPCVETLWAMRQVGSLIVRQLFKGPDPLLTDRIEQLAARFGFAVPDENRPGSVGTPGVKDKDRADLLWRFNTSGVPRDVASPRYIRAGGKLFHFDGTAWIDARHVRDASHTPVRFLSDRYFAILSENPSLGPYFALGPSVTVMHKDDALTVSPGLTNNTPLQGRHH